MNKNCTHTTILLLCLFVLASHAVPAFAKDDHRRELRGGSLELDPEPAIFNTMRKAGIDITIPEDADLSAIAKVISPVRSSQVMDDGKTTLEALMESGEKALPHTQDNRNLQGSWNVCPNSCSPLNGFGVASSMTMTLEYNPPSPQPPLCVTFTCPCKAEYKCRVGTGCKFCCGLNTSTPNCYTFDLSNLPDWCCRIDGETPFTPFCTPAQLCGS